MTGFVRASERYDVGTGKPLAHPNLGGSYQVSRWDETLGVEPADLARLTEELEETALAVLAEAGIPVRPSEDRGGDGSDRFVFQPIIRSHHHV